MDLESARARATEQTPTWQDEKVEYGAAKLQDFGQRIRSIGRLDENRAGEYSYSYYFSPEEDQPPVTIVIRARCNVTNGRAIGVQAHWSRGIISLGSEVVDFQTVTQPTVESLAAIEQFEQSLLAAEAAYEQDAQQAAAYIS